MRRALTGLLLLGTLPASASAADAGLALMRDFMDTPEVRFELTIRLPAYCAQQACQTERDAARLEAQGWLDDMIRSDVSIRALVEAGRVGWKPRTGPDDSGDRTVELQITAAASSDACPALLRLKDPRLSAELVLTSGSKIGFVLGATITLLPADAARSSPAARASMRALTGHTDLLSVDLTQSMTWSLPAVAVKVKVSSPTESPRMIGDVALPLPNTGGPSYAGRCEWQFHPSMVAR